MSVSSTCTKLTTCDATFSLFRPLIRLPHFFSSIVPQLQLNLSLKNFDCVSLSLQNSPLFQYLHDLGHTDFEACPTASQEEEYGGQEGDLPSPGEDQQKTSVRFPISDTNIQTHINPASQLVD